jgi:hypothetical protein
MATSVDAWFEQGSARQKAQLTELRSILKATVPDAVESLKWGQPCYDRHGLFCYLQRAKTHVTLGFQKGAVMHDPHGVLRGAGKQMRQVTFQEGDEVDAAVCADLIREAIRVDGDRNVEEAP